MPSCSVNNGCLTLESPQAGATTVFPGSPQILIMSALFLDVNVGLYLSWLICLHCPQSPPLPASALPRHFTSLFRTAITAASFAFGLFKVAGPSLISRGEYPVRRLTRFIHSSPPRTVCLKPQCPLLSPFSLISLSPDPISPPWGVMLTSQIVLLKWQACLTPRKAVYYLIYLYHCLGLYTVQFW